MAEASRHLKSDAQESADWLTNRVGSTGRTLISFVAVLIALIVIWQGAKALFKFDAFTLPNVGEILGGLFQPVQEGQPLLGQILLSAALYTIREGVAGFIIGAGLGFVLAVIFAHSRLIER